MNMLNRSGRARPGPPTPRHLARLAQRAVLTAGRTKHLPYRYPHRLVSAAAVGLDEG